jgi:uncharacterized protein YdeI (YjbR/CyaY-like superfamily)
MVGEAPAAPRFFAAPAELGAWLAEHHATARELWVGFHKVATGRPSLTWPESVDEALCWGWIDGVRKSLGAESYVIRFTPRKAGSIWSAVNIRRMGELIAADRVAPAGMAAFAARTADKSAIYAYEQRQSATLDAEAEARFRAQPGAWELFCALPAWYRRTATYWVVSAKKPETRERRLAELISRSAAGLPIKELDRRPKTPG